MLEEVGSYDAKTKLPEILRRVELDKKLVKAAKKADVEIYKP